MPNWTRLLGINAKRSKTVTRDEKLETSAESADRPKPRFSSGVYAIVNAVSKNAFLYPKA